MDSRLALKKTTHEMLGLSFFGCLVTLSSEEEFDASALPSYVCLHGHCLSLVTSLLCLPIEVTK